MPLQRSPCSGSARSGTLAAKLLHHGGFDVTGIDSRDPQEALPFALRPWTSGPMQACGGDAGISTRCCRACRIGSTSGSPLPPTRAACTTST